MELMDSLMQQYYDAAEDAREAIYEEGTQALTEDECPYEEGTWMSEVWNNGRLDKLLFY